MYRKEKRIPTLLALFLLVLGISTTVYLDHRTQSLTSSASPLEAPEEAHFTNITDSSFAISWLTSTPVIGSAIVSDTTGKLNLLDDLDNDNIPRPRTTHYITVKGLAENTSYTVQILSGKNQCRDDKYCPSFTQKTAVRLTNVVSLPPVRGMILKTGEKPADGTIVYLVISKSAPLSARVDSSGLWVVPLNNLRTNDLLTRPLLTDSDLIQITAKLSPSESTSAVIDIKSIRQNLSVPNMTIGSSYNFIDLISKKDLLAQGVGPKILGIKTQITPSPTAKVDVLFPKNDNETTTDNRPRFRGMGKPNSQLTITVNSSPQTGKVTVGTDGTWIWRPAKELPPGVHYISIQGYDEKGNLVTVNRKFIVLKSGEAVLGDATPSASLTPSPLSKITPTITPTLNPSQPSLTPSPTSFPYPTETLIPTSVPPVNPPRSGNTSATWILLGSGASLLLLGIKLFARL